MKYILTVSLLLVSVVLFGQKPRPVNSNEFVTECMKTTGDAANKQMVIWYPYNFWEIVGEQMKASPQFIENLTTEMKQYMMFCVVDYTSSAFGIKFKSEDEIRKNIVFIDSANNSYRPLEEQELSADARQLINSLRPTMAKMLGQFGEGMCIFLFKAKMDKGRPVIDIQSKNHFGLSWNSVSLNWKLPLASVMPPLYCPIDREKMNGNWIYCPFHGVKLSQ